ncbi:2'-5' RNA ligase family protein [Nocardioides panacisoli]|uniref:2'-5' RNA ligase family protein n=1 Tax=Nocardioides panacisoli TaxID=627624 RepID=UPI001C62C965|nr:2'-5' RNA ligase family protein [Nocardioides panacisoli]QYJ02822.1 2'-5' RNA ligase family protein [Nocardioides panacisoli]
MPDHALELTLAATSADAVTGLWQVLRDAGLPSLADHRGTTNAPHLTLAAAPDLTEAVVAPAAIPVAPLLPADLAVRGLVVLGTGRRVALALLVEPEAGFAAAVADLRRRVPDLRHPGWVPHVSLALRLPREFVPQAWTVLEAHAPPATLRADRLRWWDPDRGRVRWLGGAPGAQ